MVTIFDLSPGVGGASSNAVQCIAADIRCLASVGATDLCRCGQDRDMAQNTTLSLMILSLEDRLDCSEIVRLLVRLMDSISKLQSWDVEKASHVGSHSRMQKVMKEEKGVLDPLGPQAKMFSVATQRSCMKRSSPISCQGSVFHDHYLFNFAFSLRRCFETQLTCETVSFKKLVNNYTCIYHAE